MTTPIDNQAIPLTAAMRYAERFDGHQIVSLGEDGDSWLIVGHLTDDDVLTVVNAHLDHHSRGPLDEHDGLRIAHQWCAFRPHRDSHCPDGCYCDESLWWTDYRSARDLIENPDADYYAITEVTW